LTFEEFARAMAQIAAVALAVGGAFREGPPRCSGRGRAGAHGPGSRRRRAEPVRIGRGACVANRIDEIVFAALKTQGLEPARLSSDAVFVRRAYLDVIGTLPTADEARAFIEDRDPRKRSALIDRCWRARSSPTTGR